MKGWNWDRMSEGFCWGVLISAGALLLWACAMPTGNARQATVDHNAVNVPIEADIQAQIAEQVQAGLANFETRVGQIEASLVGPVSVGPIGGTHVGGDQTTVDSLTAQILAKTLKWCVLITLVTVALYVLSHRFRATRCVLDWAKGKTGRHEGTKALRHEGNGRAPVVCVHGNGDAGMN